MRMLHCINDRTASDPFFTEGNHLKTFDCVLADPLFVGYSFQSKEQKSDILSVYVDEKGKPYKAAGKIDYVTGWYFKASEFIQGTKIRCAFVPTNSITQGEQVTTVWKPLYDRFGIHVDFGWRTFVWDSEANDKARVHVVIVGFSSASSDKEKYIFEQNEADKFSQVNAYLIDAPAIFMESRKTPLCNVSPMTTGNRPTDGGNLIIEEKDYEDFISREPKSKKFIKRLAGASEFINIKKRYCLWLVGASPAELKSIPLVMKRIELCRADRENAPDPGRRKLADLYDPLTMPPERRKAHPANDIAVMKAYGFSTKMSEADCVGELMRMYQELVERQKSV